MTGRPAQVWAGASLLLLGCAGKPSRLISGEFGEVPAPGGDKAAEVTLRDGSVRLARKLHQEEDSLFAVLLDFSCHPIPEDSVLSIVLLPMGEMDKVHPEAGPLLGKEKKVALRVGAASSLVAFGALLPLLLLMWFVNDRVD